jgi:hypothetical protein
MITDGATLDSTHAYRLLIGSILPRAIDWISTMSVFTTSLSDVISGLSSRPACIKRERKSRGCSAVHAGRIAEVKFRSEHIGLPDI